MPDGEEYTSYVAGLGGALEAVESENPTATFPVGLQYKAVRRAVGRYRRHRQVGHVGTATVASGVVTFANPNETALKLVAAIGYVAPFMSAKLAYGAQMGSPLNQKKRIDHIGLILDDTHNQGLQVGQRMDTLTRCRPSRRSETDDNRCGRNSTSRCRKCRASGTRMRGSACWGSAVRVTVGGVVVAVGNETRRESHFRPTVAADFVALKFPPLPHRVGGTTRPSRAMRAATRSSASAGLATGPTVP